MTILNKSNLSSWHISSCDVPQGSVFGPLILRHVHHSTQYFHFLLFPKPSPLRRWHLALSSFLPTHFDSSINHLQNVLNRISSWTTVNLLTLNSSKTEFLLISLSKQLVKKPQLLTQHHSLCSKHRLYIRWTPHLFWPDQLSVSKSCYSRIVSFAVSVHTSIPKQLPPSPIPLFTPSFTTATLLYYNLPKSQITRLQQIQNSLARHITPIPSYCLCTAALAKNNRAHWIQAPLTYLQSSHNHPTFKSA